MDRVQPTSAYPSGPDLDEYVDRNGTPVCTYCGSMEPAAFMQAVRDHREVGPTDKGYKVYVGPGHDKFNPAHMSLEQGDEFRQLYGEGKVNIGYPGYFYTPLYIPMTPAEPTDG